MNSTKSKKPTKYQRNQPNINESNHKIEAEKTMNSAKSTWREIGQISTRGWERIWRRSTTTVIKIAEVDGFTDDENDQVSRNSPSCASAWGEHRWVTWASRNILFDPSSRWPMPVLPKGAKQERCGKINVVAVKHVNHVYWSTKNMFDHRLIWSPWKMWSMGYIGKQKASMRQWFWQPAFACYVYSRVWGVYYNCTCLDYTHDKYAPKKTKRRNAVQNQ